MVDSTSKEADQGESTTESTRRRQAEVAARSKKAHDRVQADLKADKSHANWLAAILAVVLAGAAVGLLWIGIAGVPQPLERLDASGLWPALFLLVAAVVAPTAILFSQKYRGRQAQQSQREIERLAELSIHIEKDEALADLLSFNFELMDRFVGVALTQARAAYAFCAVASSAALLVLLGGTAAVLSASGTGTQVTVAALTGVGTLLSGFIAHTFQRQYAAATRQMSFYYGQPLVHCYLLHAEWLAQREADEEKTELVAATLEAGRFAQLHLADLLQRVPTARGTGRTAPGTVAALLDETLMPETVAQVRPGPPSRRHRPAENGRSAEHRP